MDNRFTGTSTGIGRYRWTICALLFFATTINYMDRQILGLLAPILEKEIGWSELQYGRIVMAFQAAYALGLLGFGRIIDKVGTRHGYGIAVVIWSIMAAAHALAKSVWGFGLARFGLGVGEAGNFPAAVKAVAEWFPRRERALATGIFNSGANIGTVVAPILVPWLTSSYGWQTSFVILGALGFVWMVLWYALYDAPERSTRVSATELAYIQSDAADPAGDPVRWRDVIGHRQTWAFIVGMSFSSPIWWFYLYWLPKFLNKQYGLELLNTSVKAGVSYEGLAGVKAAFSNVGWPMVLIYSITCFGSVGGGAISSWMIQRGMSLNASRKTAMLVCALCVVPVIFASQASDKWTAALLIGLAAAAHQGWAANLFTLVSDLFPKRAVASVVGIGSMFGSLTAMGFSELVGWTLQTQGSYWSLFLIAGFAYIVAFAIMHLLVPDWKPAQLKVSTPQEQALDAASK